MNQSLTKNFSLLQNQRSKAATYSGRLLSLLTIPVLTLSIYLPSEAFSNGGETLTNEAVRVCLHFDDGTYKTRFVESHELDSLLETHPDSGFPGQTVANTPDYSFSTYCVPTTAEPKELKQGCYDNPLSMGDTGSDDLFYRGPIDTINNARFHHAPRDGSCAGEGYINDSAVIYATSEEEARIKCNSLISVNKLYSLENYQGMEGYWHCAHKSNSHY